MNPEQISVIERLRAAAREHGEVADLLDVLSSALCIDELENKSIPPDLRQLEYLKAAMLAAKFAEYDRSR